jgi:hypothetical protein
MTGLLSSPDGLDRNLSVRYRHPHVHRDGIVVVDLEAIRRTLADLVFKDSRASSCCALCCVQTSNSGARTVKSRLWGKRQV